MVKEEKPALRVHHAAVNSKRELSDNAVIIRSTLELPTLPFPSFALEARAIVRGHCHSSRADCILDTVALS